jgi:hypothetical protein
MLRIIVTDSNPAPARRPCRAPRPTSPDRAVDGEDAPPLACPSVVLEAMRAWAVGAARRTCPVRLAAPVLLANGAGGAIGPLHDFMDALAWGAARRIAIVAGGPASADETALIAAIDLAGAGALQAARASLSRMVAADGLDAVVHHGALLAFALRPAIAARPGARAPAASRGCNPRPDPLPLLAVPHP